jgi:hypothetical protein
MAKLTEGIENVEKTAFLYVQKAIDAVVGRVLKFREKILPPIQRVERFILGFQGLVDYARELAGASSEGFKLSSVTTGLASMLKEMGAKYKGGQLGEKVNRLRGKREGINSEGKYKKNFSSLI